MVAPIIAVAAIAAVSGAVQYYNAEKARGATKAELNRIKDLYDQLIPPGYDLSIEDPPNMHEQRLREPQFADAMDMPNWNLEKMDPKQFEMVQKFAPQIAPLIAEARPDLIEKSPEMKEGLDAQKLALRKFMSMGEGEFDPEYAQKVQDAKRRTQSEAQSRSDSIMQDFERRGMGGSGMELASKIGASSTAMDRNAAMGMDAEAEAYRNQLNAIAQGANIGGQIYSQEEGTQTKNADIINAFNQRMSKRHQDWEMMRADSLNAADLSNIKESQRISDMNVQGSNRADEMHRNRIDDITRFNFGAQRSERDRLDQQENDRYQRDMQQRSYDDAREILQAKWRQDNTQNKNSLMDRTFGNNQTIIAGKAGISQNINANTIGAAQDKNAAIQGMTNILSQGMMGYGNQKSQQAENDKDREAYGNGYGNSSQNRY